MPRNAKRKGEAEPSPRTPTLSPAPALEGVWAVSLSEDEQMEDVETEKASEHSEEAEPMEIAVPSPEVQAEEPPPPPPQMGGAASSGLQTDVGGAGGPPRRVRPPPLTKPEPAAAAEEEPAEKAKDEPPVEEREEPKEEEEASGAEPAKRVRFEQTPGAPSTAVGAGAGGVDPGATSAAVGAGAGGLLDFELLDEEQRRAFTGIKIEGRPEAALSKRVRRVSQRFDEHLGGNGPHGED